MAHILRDYTLLVISSSTHGVWKGIIGAQSGKVYNL